MSKAEERALEKYPYAEICREKYIEGYRQAEKDLALTWEDIKEICVQSVLVEVDLGGLVSDERHYTEVLNRFKKLKGK